MTVQGADCKGDISVRVSSGKASITDAICENFVSEGSTGAITLKNVIAGERFSIERSTGDVRFDGCDAGEIFVRTGTGNVTGSLLTDKVFAVKTGTGRIEIPETMTGGRCEVTTSTGNIGLSVQ